MPEVTLGLAGGFSHGRVITELSSVVSPAVGTPLTITVNPRYWERPLALTFLLTTGMGDSVTTVTLQYLDYDGVAFASLDTGPSLAASSSATYSFLADWQGASAWSNSIVNCQLPSVFLQGGYQIVATPTGTFSAGQITAVRWYRERFITGKGGYEIGRTFWEPDDLHRTQVLADELA